MTQDKLDVFVNELLEQASGGINHTGIVVEVNGG